MQTIEFESLRERHAELLREAEEERLARRLRKNSRRRGTFGLLRHASTWMGLVTPSRRPASEVE